MSGAQGAKKEDKATIEVGFVPSGHMVAGYIAYLKVIDETGDYYWASRDNGLNTMEMLGMAQDMVNEYQSDLAANRRNAADDG